MKTVERLVFILSSFLRKKGNDKIRRNGDNDNWNWIVLINLISFEFFNFWKSFEVMLTLDVWKSWGYVKIRHGEFGVHFLWNVKIKKENKIKKEKTKERKEIGVGTGIDYRVIGALWEILGLRQRERYTIDFSRLSRERTNKSSMDIVLWTPRILSWIASVFQVH